MRTHRRFLTALLFSVTTAALPAHAELDPELSKRVYDTLERGNRSGDRVTRARATEAFGPLDPATTAPYAADALKDPVFEVRAAAIAAMIKLGDPRFEPALVEEMKNARADFSGVLLPILFALPEKDALRIALAVMGDEKAPSRNAILEAFSKADAKWAIAFLKALMPPAGKNPTLGEAATAVSLSLRRTDTALLLEHLLTTGTPDVKARALEAFSLLPKGADLAPVRKLLKGKDKSLAGSVAEVLARHGDKSAVPALLPGLQSGDPKQVLRTLDALLEVPDASAVAAAEPLLKKPEENIDVTRRVLELRSRLGDAKLVDTLRAYRRSDDVRLQALAVYFLGVHEKGKALPDLHESVFHGDANVRLAAIEAIGRIGHHDSIAVLRRAIDAASDPELRKALVNAVAEIKDKDIVPVLSFLISDRDADVRRAAIRGLARTASKDAVPTLKIGTQDSDVDARSEAVQAIVALDPVEGPGVYRMALGWIVPEGVEALTKALGATFAPYLDMTLTSTRPELHDAALKALATLPEKEDGIIAGAFDRTRDTGLKIKILKRMVQKRGLVELPRLEQVAKAGDGSLRAAAIQLAGGAGDATALPFLAALLDDPDEFIRVTAATAILDVDSRQPQGKKKKPAKAKGR
ncbi:MAG: HEAT repeat domain-containing protein [Myxococcales bacterium]|nr:HEAT repeat domain-containing protein [Myxococcales bacterium]